MEENPNHPRNQLGNQFITKMKLREYSNPLESHLYYDCSPFRQNVSLRIDPHLPQLLATIYERFDEEAYEFL